MRIVSVAVVSVVWFTAVWAQSLDPLVVDPQHYKLEVENQWVRVIREQM